MPGTVMTIDILSGLACTSTTCPFTPAVGISKVPVERMELWRMTASWPPMAVTKRATTSLAAGRAAGLAAAGAFAAVVAAGAWARAIAGARRGSRAKARERRIGAREEGRGERARESG